MVDPLINTNGDTRCNQSDRAGDRCHDVVVELPVAHRDRGALGTCGLLGRHHEIAVYER